MEVQPTFLYKLLDSCTVFDGVGGGCPFCYPAPHNQPAAVTTPNAYMSLELFCGNSHVYSSFTGEMKRSDEIIMKRRQNGRIIDTQPVYVARDKTLRPAVLH